MKLGSHIPSTPWEGGADRLGPTLAEIVEAAEAAGFDAIDVADHLWLHPIMGGPEASHVEAYTTLGFIAARTRRVRLLALATAASYRHAGLLAKTVTTLDVLSGGRAMLGIEDGPLRLRRRGGRVEGQRAAGPAPLAGEPGHRDGPRLGRGRGPYHAARGDGARGHPRRRRLAGAPRQHDANRTGA